MTHHNEETIVISRLKISADCRSKVFEPGQNALHEAIELKYFFSGTSTLMIGERTIEVHAGDVVVINPYEFHATLDSGRPEGQYHMLIVPLEYFSSEAVDNLNLKQLLLERRIRLLNHIESNPAIAGCFMRIIEEHRQKRKFHQMMIRSMLMEMFGLLLRENVNEYELSAASLHSYQTIEPALRNIRDNYQEKISVDSLAKLCRLSKHYFCRLFKSIIGKTVMEYVREYRIKVGYSMLENTDKSIAQIAEACGFTDDNYFCRCYREYYGISPGKYRKQMQENIQD